MFAKLRCGAGGALADAGHWPHLHGSGLSLRYETAGAHQSQKSPHLALE
jgi:hypothetical protein